MGSTEQLVISVCPGIRGLERGIERVTPLRVLAHVEIEAFIIENLVCEMEAGLLAPAPVWTNVKTFDGSPFRGKVHGIIGGYPCQPFSVAGKRDGGEDPRHLWPHIKGIIKSAGPVWCLFENVAGHLSLGYEQVRGDLQRLSYTVEEGIFSAEEVGAPHQRKRLFILAVDNGYLRRHRGQKEEVRSRRNAIEPSGQDMANAKRDGYATPEVSGSAEEAVRQESAREDNPEHIKRASVSGSVAKEVEDPTGERRRRRGDVGEEGIRPFQVERSGSLANTNDSRGGENSKCGELWTEGIEQSSGNSGGTNEGENGKEQSTRWPARPWQGQYEWEPPRVESKLGSVFNGYNFREDLLRALGNSVVEQTAERAWIVLWNKMNKNL